MEVQLRYFTQPVPELKIDCEYPCDELGGEAAAMCTGYEGDPMNALKGALSSGHESVIEHSSYTFRVDGVSRVLHDQLIRHRIASYSVKSQRYCGAPSATSCIIPESIINSPFKEAVEKLLEDIERLYTSMTVSGIVPHEDARYIAPEGSQTSLYVTMDARELKHFFSMRCCNRAQWEIRELADKMLKEVRKYAPMTFSDAGPGCVRGHCPEGSRSCGKPRNEDGLWAAKDKT